MTRRILAYAGGGWMAGDDDSPLDRHLLHLCDSPTPRICLVPTACGDAESVIERFQVSFAGLAETSVLRLFQRDVADIGSFLGEHDAIYVGGGSTANLLAVWRLHGVDDALRAAYDAGVLLAGVSAGMNCWFEASMTDSFLADTSRPLADGLGLLAGSACPHYDGEPSRRPSYLRAVGDGFPAGVAGDDQVALRYDDGELVDVVTARNGAHAYRVSVIDGGVAEKPLPTRPIA